MTPQEIQAEADYRWLERAGIYAGSRELTEHERKLVTQEIHAFEDTERHRKTIETTQNDIETHYEDQSQISPGNPGDGQR